MTILLAILTVACVSWIITREQIFAPLRKWAKPRRWLYPLQCAYCLIVWVTIPVMYLLEIRPVFFFPIVWAGYWNIALLSKARGSA